MLPDELQKDLMHSDMTERPSVLTNLDNAARFKCQTICEAPFKSKLCEMAVSVQMTWTMSKFKLEHIHKEH